MERHAPRGGGKRPLFRNANLNLAAWLPSRLAAKKSAFTLAEVLITLGIIGVVAAVTLPTLVANYQKTVWVNQLKKTYTTLNEGFKQMAASEDCTTLECAGILEDFVTIDFSKENVKSQFVKTFKLENVFVGDKLPNNSVYTYKIKFLYGGDEHSFDDYYAPSNKDTLVGVSSDGMIISFTCNTMWGAMITVDINGLKKPNTVGRDIFNFVVFDYNGTVAVQPVYSSVWCNWYFPIIGENAITEAERIQGINADCSAASTGYDMTCAEKIIMDGWKMNY